MEFSPHLKTLTQRDFQDPSPPRTAEQMYLRYSPMVGLKTGVLLLALLTAILSKIVCRWAWKRLRRRLHLKRQVTSSGARTCRCCCCRCRCRCRCRCYWCCLSPCRGSQSSKRRRHSHHEVDDPLRLKQFPTDRVQPVVMAQDMLPTSCSLMPSVKMNPHTEDSVFIERGQQQEPIAIICKSIDYSKDKT